MHRLIFTTALCGLLCVPIAASAQGSDEVIVVTDRLHDGFHFVLGLGAGYTTTNISFDPTWPGDPNINANAGGTAGLLLFGGTPINNLAIGLSVLSGGHFVDPTINVEDSDLEYESEQDIVVNLIGPYMDYYFGPQSNAHLLFVIGAGVLRDADEDTDGVATGVGAALGFGYDFRISNEIAIGVLGRLQYLSTSQDVEIFGVDAGTVNYRTVYPSILATFVYH